ncbi:phosphoprotein [Tupaia virus]|uniref:Phosphoprotein n=1 Tax=Tupaia virus (isolate Tupaia/Thailand/-/1986) TaxID=1560034 RepID=PHOSP_TUPVT|nr:phosphoprotein [Tupaia virus]Q4VKV7.1 RecName: Full=Phosphoprotein; Short=P protein [Tupaia virus isolate Tupaia/Thailand/-/1986]AAX47597.1 phosphoprotein [Tupaia virus]
MTDPKKISRVALKGYDLTKVSRALEECEDQPGVRVGGVQIVSGGEAEAPAHLEDNRQGAIGDNFDVFSRDSKNVQIVTEHEDSSDEEYEEARSYGDDSGHQPNRAAVPFADDEYGDFKRARERLPQLFHEGWGFGSQQANEESSEGLQQQSGECGSGGGSSNAGGKDEDDLQEKTGHEKEKSVIVPPKESGSVSGYHGSCDIPFNMEEFLASPATTQRRQLLELCQLIADRSNEELIFFPWGFNLVKRKVHRVEPQQPVAVSHRFTWEDFQLKLKAGFTLIHKKTKAPVVLNSSSYNLGSVPEGGISLSPDDTELSVLIKCLRYLGLYKFLATQIEF